VPPVALESVIKYNRWKAVGGTRGIKYNSCTLCQMWV
jgi:hypothetical protein